MARHRGAARFGPRRSGGASPGAPRSLSERAAPLGLIVLGRGAVRLGLAFALVAAFAFPPPATPDSAPTQSAPQRETLPRRQVLRRALRADPGQPYLLYVPGRGGEGDPILVATHGTSRNAEEHAALFAPYAESRGLVLVAPYFPEDEFGDYQRLGREGHGRRADLALDSILAEVRSLTGAATGRFYLFGFSGGAQFAHRYALAHPERIAAAALGAAGWYTFPDSTTPYPYGLARDAEGGLPDVRFEPASFLRVPIAVFVGTADTTSANLRRNRTVDHQQGVTRLERARRWTAAMREAARARGLAALVTCETVPGIGHSFRQFMERGGLGDRVCAALFAAPRPGGAAPPAGAAR